MNVKEQMQLWQKHCSADGWTASAWHTFSSRAHILDLLKMDRQRKTSRDKVGTKRHYKQRRKKIEKEEAKLQASRTEIPWIDGTQYKWKLSFFQSSSAYDCVVGNSYQRFVDVTVLITQNFTHFRLRVHAFGTLYLSPFDIFHPCGPLRQRFGDISWSSTKVDRVLCSWDALT